MLSGEDIFHIADGEVIVFGRRQMMTLPQGSFGLVLCRLDLVTTDQIGQC
jgi:hypothetical protein